MGEFGEPVPPSATGAARDRPFNRNVLGFVARHCVPFSSTWVWEFAPQAQTYSITPGRDQVYINFTRTVNEELSTCPDAPA